MFLHTHVTPPWRAIGSQSKENGEGGGGGGGGGRALVRSYSVIV